jgi:hypothetical protein
VSGSPTHPVVVEVPVVPEVEVVPVVPVEVPIESVPGAPAPVLDVVLVKVMPFPATKLVAGANVPKGDVPRAEPGSLLPRAISRAFRS